MNTVQLSSNDKPNDRDRSLHRPEKDIAIVKRDKRSVVFSIEKVQNTLKRVGKGIEGKISIDLIVSELYANIFHGISSQDLEKALILAASAFIEKDPAYNVVASRLLLQRLYKEVFGHSVAEHSLPAAYRKAFCRGIAKGVEAGIFDKRLLDFDLPRLALSLKPEYDHLFKYMGLHTLHARYLQKIDDVRIETPQAFWMRVAMGLAIQEQNKEEYAIQFYSILSNFSFVSSTPTLFHSGTVHPQLSSCYLTTVRDDLKHIFKCLGDNAELSKWSGGVANDWSYLRATGSRIESIKVTSQGVIPFLKIANDVTGAINRSGSRRGATVVYLETWHLDIEEFLDLRRNTGDERRRTHELNTANWIPDLFMQRVQEDKDWTLFSPNDVPDLHDLYGKKFEKAYEEYEQQTRDQKIKLFKVVSAKKLWRKMLTRLFETGHPWIVFKDSCNIRSPQDHVGVVHSSNLCTEITLNTSEEETAVCNLGSISLGEHIVDGRLDREKLASTVQTAIRMLDNVVDINFYPTKEAAYSNKRHRPLGLGLMGFQDALFKLNIAFSSSQALTFADETQEFIAYHAIRSSALLAKERGAYETFPGSKWDRGIFPLDTLDLLEQERGEKVDCSRASHLDWTPVRDLVKQYGVRNSNTMAIAPTATISNISGCFPCIEPIYKNAYVKTNTDGEFTIINEYLVNDLKGLGLWNEAMCEMIKYYDGSIQQIPNIPDHIKRKYQTSFELDPEWMIKITAARGKWIDQSQSHNVFMQSTEGKKMHDVYFAAWKGGLKATYYFRTLGVSQVEKSTLDAKKYGFTQKRVYTTAPIDTTTITQEVEQELSIEQTDAGQACNIDNPDCEACQ